MDGVDTVWLSLMKSTNVLCNQIFSAPSSSTSSLPLLDPCRTILSKRKDLKLILMSATLNTSVFVDFFPQASVLSIRGRQYPVDVLYPGLLPLSFDSYTPTPEADYIDAALITILQVHCASSSFMEIDPLICSYGRHSCLLDRSGWYWDSPVSDWRENQALACCTTERYCISFVCWWSVGIPIVFTTSSRTATDCLLTSSRQPAKSMFFLCFSSDRSSCLPTLPNRQSLWMVFATLWILDLWKYACSLAVSTIRFELSRASLVMIVCLLFLSASSRHGREQVVRVVKLLVSYAHCTHSHQTSVIVSTQKTASLLSPINPSLKSSVSPCAQRFCRYTLNDMNHM